MDSKVSWMVAPPLLNSSCSHSRFAAGWWEASPSLVDLVQAPFILLLSLGILVANILLICVINSRRYAKYIHAQPRYLLTSLACNDLAIGLLVTPFAIVPTLMKCWPYGEMICQIQALLRGALGQQSAVILICMAIDRYMCMLHPVSYHKHSSKKGCVAIISLTWVTALTLFAAMVLPRGFYFNNDGLHACEPFYPRPSLRILASCLFYFPTTMVLMYCYGSAFHVNKLRLKRVVCAAIAIPEHFGGTAVEKLVAQERRLSTAASRTMAAISLSFIVMVTPWSIQEVVAACTGSKMPPFMDFIITWTALSNSFWNPFLYWLLNSNFRRIGKELIFTKLLCRDAPVTPARRTHCCNSLVHLPAVAGATLRATSDAEGINEKYWGEILERTVSSNSLQALQRIYGRTNTHDARFFPSPPCVGQMTAEI